MKVLLPLLLLAQVSAQERVDSLPSLDGNVPRSFESLWRGYDPRAEPLEVEILKEWEEDGVVLRVLRYRVGVFKGKKAMMAAIYGFPRGARRVPGLVQIHGGGQYADYRAPLLNAQRGYATISLAWAGRINAPGYRVDPTAVRLFWEGRTEDPRYKVTTDWGALDAYHAPSRYRRTVFPSVAPTPWTLDPVDSPRNSPWFLCALAARRALTFLERRPEVDPNRLGVYGHSMGGKLTVMVAAADERVAAAAPSCGGISDRNNRSPLYRATLGDDVNLRHVRCPVLFLTPSNDFHARINDLPKALNEIQSTEWRISCSPHHNHQDTPPYMVCQPLWFDQCLKKSFRFPQTPELQISLTTTDGIPMAFVVPDRSRAEESVEVYYTQQGYEGEDMINAINRFWHYAPVVRKGNACVARLLLHDTRRPVWVFANVTYRLDRPVQGAGYYYRPYKSDRFVLSTPLRTITPEELQAHGVRPALKPSLLIEDFEGDWEKEWFTYDPRDWGRRTHKVYDDCWRAPADARLALDVLSRDKNALVIGLDGYAATVKLDGGNRWERIELTPADFVDATGERLRSFATAKELRLLARDLLRVGRGPNARVKHVGGSWSGPPPRFRNLRWVIGPSQPLDRSPADS